MREEYDPDVHGSYGAWLRSKNIQARPAGWTCATRDQVLEGRDAQGRRFKTTTDQLGNDTIQHGSDQQSVRIKNPETVRATIPASALKRSPDVQR